MWQEPGFFLGKRGRNKKRPKPGMDHVGFGCSRRYQYKLVAPDGCRQGHKCLCMGVSVHVCTGMLCVLLASNAQQHPVPSLSFQTPFFTRRSLGPRAGESGIRSGTSWVTQQTTVTVNHNPPSQTPWVHINICKWMLKDEIIIFQRIWKI